jgi:hypothetical protein
LESAVVSSCDATRRLELPERTVPSEDRAAPAAAAYARRRLRVSAPARGFRARTSLVRNERVERPGAHRVGGTALETRVSILTHFAPRGSCARLRLRPAIPVAWRVGACKRIRSIRPRRRRCTPHVSIAGPVIPDRRDGRLQFQYDLGSQQSRIEESHGAGKALRKTANRERLPRGECGAAGRREPADVLFVQPRREAVSPRLLLHPPAVASIRDVDEGRNVSAVEALERSSADRGRPRSFFREPCHAEARRGGGNLRGLRVSA